MNNLIYVGTITSTHGIKGELKVKSTFEYKDRCFKKNFVIYIDGNEFTITSYRVHKQYDLITINNILDINDVYKYVGKDIFINKDDLDLNDNEFLYSDLIDCNILENNINYGTVVNLRQSNILILEVSGEKKFFIPFVDEYVDRVDINNKIIYVKRVEELII